MMRRRRPLMRAAMIGGAGYYAGKKVQEGREDDAYRDQRIYELEQQQAAQQQMQMQAPAPAAPVAAPVQSGGISDAAIEQLRKLGELHEQGILTDDEFSAKKQELLGT